ncbi:hypothetical protein [Chondromyces crocatus]|uniref:Secreted protein n=1 Tax=Chondromyces crocatus TaxID=52 RepID=A0A0K1E8T6_CHOCO|nr:hypothetical protein [Chondromyces crocatus]AKT37269.1 uncharacterized protein CMC5_014000 [Chondromyces crocatus]
MRAWKKGFACLWLALAAAGASFTGCSLQETCGGGGDGDEGAGCEGPLDEQCPADFKNEAEGEVTLRFRNESADPIYLGPRTRAACGFFDGFSLKTASGDDVPWYFDPCETTCETLHAECLADCAEPPVYKIEANGSIDIRWNGLIRQTRALSCEGESQTSCTQRVRPSADLGPLTVTGQIYTQVLDCNANENCDCEPVAPATSCLIPRVGSSDRVTLSGAQPTTSAAYEDGQAMVELVFR